MNHYTFCYQCFEEGKGTNIIAKGEINSNLIAICECSNGHKFISGLMHELFDILYLSAVDSYFNGSFSESVMSFTASLERTYEFFIKVTLLKEGCTLEMIDSFWKEIKNQSERQLGSFCSQYLNITKSPWNLNTEMIGFRNGVVHKGYIATSEEVKKYAEYTTSLQMNILNILKDDYEDECRQLYFHQKEFNRKSTEKLQNKTNLKFVATSHPSILKWDQPGKQSLNFEEALETYNKTYYSKLKNQRG